MIKEFNPDKIFNEVYEWLELVRNKECEKYGTWKYNIHMDRCFGAESTAFAVITLFEMGKLNKLTSRQIEEIGNCIKGWQNPESGVFIDPLVKDSDRVLDNHTWEHIWNHVSNMCFQALAVLESKPDFPLPKTSFGDLEKVNVRDWILSLGWENPWMVGEHVASAIRSYRLSKGLIKIDQTDEIIDLAYKTIENEILDIETGMPNKRGCKDTYNMFTGLFKLMFAYLPFNKPIPFAEKAIDFILALQHENGQFDGGGMCQNFDAIWVLYYLSKQFKNTYRFGDIKNAGYKLADFLLREHRKYDGGFSFEPHSCLEIHNSIKISDSYLEGDMVGTYMAVKCLMYLYEWENIIKVCDSVDTLTLIAMHEWSK